MIIETRNMQDAVTVTAWLIAKQAGFTVHTLEIFQSGPTIETGDDMWDSILELSKANPGLSIYFKMVTK